MLPGKPLAALPGSDFAAPTERANPAKITKGEKKIKKKKEEEEQSHNAF